MACLEIWTDKGLVDFIKGTVVNYQEHLEEILYLIREDAQHFDCVDQVQHAKRHCTERDQRPLAGRCIQRCRSKRKN